MPRLYPIADASCFSNSEELLSFAEALAAAGCTLLQYRNKVGGSRQMLHQAERLKQRMAPSLKLIMNDRADLCIAAGFDGVHLGQEDLSAEDARRLIGSQRCIGVSTHNPKQLAEAEQTSADYLAIGPVFSTSSKERPDPIVGLQGVRQARQFTRKPLVAIGGITLQNCRAVLDAGADSVAVISALVTEPRKSAEDFFRILG